MAVKLLHTSNWHIGCRFPGFSPAAQSKLSHARFEVIDALLQAPEGYGVDAVLCAGDLFDSPTPPREHWDRVLRSLLRSVPRCPWVLLPGNHDPLIPGSVYAEGHEFRRALPRWIHIVDRDDFALELGPDVILHARPCRARASQDGPALALPARDPDDMRTRIGLVHGSAEDVPGSADHFPIAKDAAVQRGFDYLALGDAHAFRNLCEEGQPPTVYPGAPEPARFGEGERGEATLVWISGQRRVRIQRERLGHWIWRSREIRDLDALRRVAADSELARSVLRLDVRLRLSAKDLEEAERILAELEGSDERPGSVGVLQLMKRLELDTQHVEAELGAIPDVLRTTFACLRAREAEQPEAARAAQLHLFKLLRHSEAS